MFYCYSNDGMTYHPTGKAAKAAAEKAINSGTCPVTLLDRITWGEVTEVARETGAGYALKNALRADYELLHPQVVDGRMHNENDDLVLVRNIHEKDLLYHDLVLSIAVIWKDLSGKIERFKGYNFRDVQTVLALLNEKYGVVRGGEEGNMTFFTFDRRFKLQIAIQKAIGFGPELQMAQAKLLEAADQITPIDGENSTNASDARTIVTASFKLVNGQVRVSAVLQLRRLKIANALWNEGMAIIDEAIIVTGKKKQVRFYERNDVGRYIAIPLDIAGL
jgi:hypothetical protein